jgi:hypothetical protein
MTRREVAWEPRGWGKALSATPKLRLKQETGKSIQDAKKGGNPAAAS